MGRRKKRSVRRKIANAEKELIKAANSIHDLIPAFSISPPFQPDYRLAHVNCKALDQSTREWIFNLTKRNVSPMYERMAWGWSDRRKRAELFSPYSKYLIVCAADSNEQVAFSHFRFVVDHSFPVLYCYEMQVEEAHQRKGIGGMILRVLQEISTSLNLCQIMATVFTFNDASLRFFQKNNFTEDITSKGIDSEAVKYTILSKKTTPYSIVRSN